MTLQEEVNLPLTYKPADFDIPAERIYGSYNPDPEHLRAADPASLASTWLSAFNSVLSAAVDSPESLSDPKALPHLLLPHAAWRDHVTFQWDLRTWTGLDKVIKNVGAKQARTQIKDIKLDPLAHPRVAPSGAHIVTFHEPKDGKPAIEWLQCYVTFITAQGTGQGIIKLVSVDGDSPGGLRALTVYTVLDQIKGSEERVGGRRPEGVNHGENIGRKSWLERRTAEQKFGDSAGRQPAVLIVGGGQGGLNVAARLKTMGVDSLIVEKNPRIGDNWRNRYKFLVLHDPVWYDHLSYLNFPPTWPIFTPKDKLGDWFEAYAKSLELNTMLSTVVDGATFNDETGIWEVKVRNLETGEEQVLRPQHVVMATGHSGEPNIPTFPGIEKFKGSVKHSSQHKTGADFTGKNTVVVGSCNSAHDIAQDMYEQGAKVTMIQRSSTNVVSADWGLPIINKGVYDEDGPRTEIADVMSNSNPLFLQNLVLQQFYRQIAVKDKDLLDGLQKAGMKLDFGYGHTGLFGKYARRGGGYYIDVGCSQLIIDGKIAIKSGVTVDHFEENAVVLTDGTRLEDVAAVVLATGYSNMKDTAKRIFGGRVGEILQQEDVWGFDEEGELRAIWRKSCHPNFWYMGGNLALSRFYSKRLALQIVAALRGLE